MSNDPPESVGNDPKTLALLVCVAFATHALLTLALALREGVPLSSLAVYQDGHLYLEIAKSYPLPYAPEALHYTGQAPGYPGLVYLVHLVTPDAWVDWGAAALLASWLSAAAAAGAFFVLCQTLGMRPVWPTLAFVFLNPRWLSQASIASPEPLAECFAIACFAAWLRGRLGWSVALLSLAALCRFPAILLGAPLALGVLVFGNDRRLRVWLTLATPLLVLGLFQLYLAWRVPGFGGIWSEHRVFWEAGFTWPFQMLWRLMGPGFILGPYLFALTYGSVAVYCLAIAVGFRPSERERWVFAVWTLVVVVFHASLTGREGVWHFTRLAILAWPPALLILWRWAGPRLEGAPALGLLVIGLLAGSANALLEGRVFVQHQAQRFLGESIELLGSDEPRWIDFHETRGPKWREWQEHIRAHPGAGLRRKFPTKPPGPDPP